MDESDRLDSLVLQRDKESQRDLLSVIYMQWGVMNILGVWIYVLVWPSLLFWVVWIPAGIVVMSAFIYWKMKDVGRSLWDRSIVQWIWTAVLLALPLLIWVFPGLLNLYPYTWIFPLTSAWVAMGLYATGAFLKITAIALGSVVFWVSAPLHFLFPTESPWIFSGANFLGLFIPGLASAYLGRR